ncbi:porin [Comamonas nitrativorans]|uniref:Porin n=1 Tax=Comamonas nitrativorans TaxID=108437 RepID=A0ABV9GV00_9BURK
MKPTIRKRGMAVAGMALLAAGAASAQSNVQVYGMVDAGVEYLSRVGGSGSLMRMPTVTSGIMPSRVGFRGTEDLGRGLKAVFVLEMGLALDSGELMQSGRGFGRQAYVGLSGDWGALTLGRQYAMGLYAMMGSDLMGPAVFGLGSLNAYIPNQRLDNAVAYRGKFGHWEVGALYSAGRDSLRPSNCAGENGSSDCDAYSAMVKYATPAWGATLAHDRLKGGAGSAFFGQPAGLAIGKGSRDDHTYLTGYYLLDKTRLGAGVIHRSLKAVGETYRSNQYYLAASHPVTDRVVLDATYTYLDANRKKANAQLLSVRGNYLFSKRTKAYALIGTVHNDANVGYSVSGGTAAPASPGLGKGQTGVMVGLFHAF